MYYLDSKIENLYRIFDQNERKDYKHDDNSNFDDDSRSDDCSGCTCKPQNGIGQVITTELQAWAKKAPSDEVI